MKKIIITERQYNKLENSLRENIVYTNMVERIKNDLNSNYEKFVGVVRKGGEYIEKPMVKIKIDGESISPKALFDYLKYKYNLGEEFLKQLLRDWYSDKIKNNSLSKNVPLE